MSHLDLGRDAANLHDPARPDRPWARPLLDAYQAAPGRLALHFLPLHTEDLAELTETLRRRPPRDLDDAAGRHLLDRFHGALEEELPAFEEAWLRASKAAAARREKASLELAKPLARLRAALWSRAGESPPPMRVLDCPALGSRARAMGVDRGGESLRVVATSLDGEWQQILCRIFHEDVHPLSDPEAWAPFRGEKAARDTRAGTDGHRVHLAIERAAVELGAQVVAEHAPELMRAYCDWRTEVWPAR